MTDQKGNKLDLLKRLYDRNLSFPDCRPLKEGRGKSGVFNEVHEVRGQ